MISDQCNIMSLCILNVLSSHSDAELYVADVDRHREELQHWAASSFEIGLQSFRNKTPDRTMHLHSIATISSRLIPLILIKSNSRIDVMRLYELHAATKMADLNIFYITYTLLHIWQRCASVWATFSMFKCTVSYIIIYHREPVGQYWKDLKDLYADFSPWSLRDESWVT